MQNTPQSPHPTTQVSHAQPSLFDCCTQVEYLRRVKQLDQRGSIQLILGTMFAGKSTELLRRLRLLELAGKSILRLKYSADTRYDNTTQIATHCGQKIQAVPINRLGEIGDVWRNYDVIGIDEGQFFPDLVDFAELAANSQKIVIISSLQGTFQRTSWDQINTLIPLCEKVDKLSAICKLCKVNASFTFRTADKNQKNMIGGADMYMPLCRDCHQRETSFNQSNVFEGNPQLMDPQVEHEATALK